MNVDLNEIDKKLLEIDISYDPNIRENKQSKSWSFGLKMNL